MPEVMELNRKFSLIGDRELGSKVIWAGDSCETPSRPRPAISGSSIAGVRGVGVRGGRGMGRLEAILTGGIGATRNFELEESFWPCRM